MRAALSFSALLSLVCVAGCETDLGKCDMAVAMKVVYSASGVPYYEGQALVHQSCANGVCHAESAKNDGRIGAPHGLNFDVRPLESTSTAFDLEVLKSGHDRIRDEAGEIYDVVDSGEMPPGEAGERVPLAWKTLDASMKPTVATTVPDVHGGAGKEVLRNWLACEAPVIAGITGAPAGTEKIGIIAPAAAVTIEPTFASIYSNVLSDSCLGCHNGMLFTDQQDLDFSTVDSAYASLVGVDTFASGMCGGAGKLVAGMDCESSVLYQKLSGAGKAGAMLCGAKMPIGPAALSDDTLAAICEWIDGGAAK